MKKKEKKQLQELSTADLQKQAVTLEQSIREKLRDAKTKQVKNVHEIRSLKKTVAIVKTIIRKKELTQ